MKSNEGSLFMPFSTGSSTAGRSKQLRLRPVITLVLIVITLACIVQWMSSSGSSLRGMKPSTSKRTGTRYTLPNTYTGDYPSVPINNTFGFQKAYVISLPARFDQRDTLSLLRKSSGFDLEVVEGVYGNKIMNERLSYWDPKKLLPGALGCYRSHINVWKKMVDENIESAIIFEEDVDWVVDLDTSLRKLQHPLASLLTSHKDGQARVIKEDDPYNHNDWDVLNLGACMERAFTEKNARPWTLIHKNFDFWDRPPYLTYQDDSVPDGELLMQDLKNYMKDYNMPLYDQTTPPQARKRVVTRSYEPWCLTAYALSNRGAFRLLYGASITMNEPADVAVGFTFQDLLAEGYTVVPPLFGQWKIDKAGGAPSDREAQDQKIKTLSGGNPYNPWRGRSTNLGASYRQQLAQKHDLPVYAHL